jgi:hypothetical protein
MVAHKPTRAASGSEKKTCVMAIMHQERIEYIVGSMAQAQIDASAVRQWRQIPARDARQRQEKHP